MPQVVQPQAGQTRLGADAVPLILDVVDGPRGWPVMQEAAAAAFRRGSCAAARDATGRKAL